MKYRKGDHVEQGDKEDEEQDEEWDYEVSREGMGGEKEGRRTEVGEENKGRRRGEKFCGALEGLNRSLKD